MDPVIILSLVLLVIVIGGITAAAYGLAVERKYHREVKELRSRQTWLD